MSTPVARWVGERLRTNESYGSSADAELGPDSRWPSAAWGRSGERQAVTRSMWPVAYSRPHLHEFLAYEPNLLSVRATAGFLGRTARGNLRIPDDLIAECRAHLDAMTSPRRLAAA